MGARLDHLPQPHPLLVRREVLDLVGDRAAVRLAHAGQGFEQRLALDPDPQDPGRDLRHQLGGQVEVLRLERRVALGGSLGERIDPRRQVPVGAVGLQQRGRGLHGLHQLLGGLAHRRPGRARGGAGPERRRGCRRRVGVGDDGGRDLERLGDALVELVLALKQLVDAPQERPGLRPLDHPVVVGRGHRHHLGDAERLDLVGRGVRPLHRVGDRAGGDDRALALHQPGHGGDRSQPARVRQRDVRALEVVGRELVLTGLVDQLLVVGVEAREVEPVGALDRRDHQRARALALDVDGDPEADRAGLDGERLVLAKLERAAHHRELLGRLDDRPGDQMGERDLHPAVLEHAVERPALGVERVDGDRPERCRRRDLPALVHRLREHRGGAAERLRLPGCRRRRRGRGAVALGRQNVGLDDLPARAGALDRAERDAAVGGDPPGDGGGAVV